MKHGTELGSARDYQGTAEFRVRRSLKAKRNGATPTRGKKKVRVELLEKLPLWQLDIVEVTGHNLEARGREEVNRLLHEGWRLLHVYTLKYEEDGVWRERPMGILGKPRSGAQQGAREEERS